MLDGIPSIFPGFVAVSDVICNNLSNENWVRSSAWASASNLDWARSSAWASASNLDWARAWVCIWTRAFSRNWDGSSVELEGGEFFDGSSVWFSNCFIFSIFL